MSWIRTIAPEEATGFLRKVYDDAVRRAGRVYQIVRAMSLNAQVTEASMGLYGRIMFAREGLSRAQRELIATVVSRANHCHY